MYVLHNNTYYSFIHEKYVAKYARQADIRMATCVQIVRGVNIMVLVAHLSVNIAHCLVIANQRRHRA